jgi:4-hydroxy-tetrahydrodipicolinate reductase
VIRVGVVGAGGRMGREVCRTVVADPDLELVAAIDPALAGGSVEEVEVSGELPPLTDARVEVAVDFTHASAVLDTIRWAIPRGIHMVVGTTGVAPSALEEIRTLTDDADANVLIAPNFAVGAVLAIRFAEAAARYMPAAEVIELHHDGKADAPSGTALTTARRIAAARSSTPLAPAGDDAHPGARGAEVEGVRVHSVRLPGLVAHQEVILGGPGQILSIRHDSIDRSSFMPGVVMAVKAVSSRRGLTVGLDAILDDI